VGASVNVVTPSAFDRKETFASITAAGGYYNGPRHEFKENETTPYSASGIFGTQFGGGKWGLVLGGSYSYRHYISNRNSGGIPWFPAGPAGSPGANIYFPAVDALFHYDVQRWREGANMALEFKPNDQHYFAFRITENQFQDTEGREQSNFEFFRTAYPATYTPTTATFTGGRATVEYRYYRQEHNITNYSLEGRHNLNPDTKLTYLVALGNAEKQTPDRQDWEFRTAANLTSTLDTSNFHWDLTPGAAYYNAASYPFRRVRFRKDDEHEDNANARVDLNQSTTKLGKNGFWQAGLKYFKREKGWDRTNKDYLAGTGANLFNLSQYGLSHAPYEMFGGYREMAPQINLDVAQALFVSNPNFFVPNTAGDLSDSNVTDFDMEETIMAGYVEAKYGSDKWSVLAGVRVENTDGDVTQTQLPTAGSVGLPPTYNHINKKYTNVLPGIHFRANPTKQWVLRASWTNTIGRPNYPDMAGAAQYTYVEDAPPGSGIYTGSVTSGNPNLEPYESMNFDVGSEYYFKHQGMLAIGVFYKQLDNPIFTNAGLLRNVTYDGKQFSSLSYSRPENADSGKISGVEVNYTQDFTMLPSPFDGLRFSVNATFSDSEERIFSRPTEDLRFIKQPNRIYNVALGYEKYGFSARVAYTYTGDFIKSFGSDINGDSFQSEREIIDAKISYRINKHFTVFADVINLGEEPLNEYAGYANRMSATEAYWWTANFGVTWKL
jgi:TonB-dependent receptor